MASLTTTSSPKRHDHNEALPLLPKNVELRYGKNSTDLHEILQPDAFVCIAMTCPPHTTAAVSPMPPASVLSIPLSRIAADLHSDSADHDSGNGGVGDFRHAHNRDYHTGEWF